MKQTLVITPTAFAFAFQIRAEEPPPHYRHIQKANFGDLRSGLPSRT